MTGTTLKITPDNIGTGKWVGQWSYSDDDSTYFPISGATADSYTPPQTVSRYYKVVATRTGATANVRVFYEYSTPYVQAIASQNGTLDVTYTPQVIGVLGSAANWTYHWYFTPEIGGPEENKGVTSGPYTISTVDCTERGYYRVDVSDSCGPGADASAYANLYVDNCP
jgi:hypothetical protein